jgi:hypothetical protein
MRTPLSFLFPTTAGAADRRPDDRHDDGFVVELIRTGALFGDLSLERWLDRVERREERA